MKLFVVLALVAVAAAAPASAPGAESERKARQSGQYDDIQLLRYYFNNLGLDSYNFGYEQSNGQAQEESGQLQNVGTDNESLAVKGSYEWIGPDNVKYVVNYIADENGYQPTIEQGPGGGVPPAVVASLLG